MEFSKCFSFLRSTFLLAESLYINSYFYREYPRPVTPFTSNERKDPGHLGTPENFVLLIPSKNRNYSDTLLLTVDMPTLHGFLHTNLRASPPQIYLDVHLCPGNEPHSSFPLYLYRSPTRRN